MEVKLEKLSNTVYIYCTISAWLGRKENARVKNLNAMSL
jgi:hypothetical protein